jgi:D-serine deaminase-like pyridoxal phosphate-dependent protein
VKIPDLPTPALVVDLDRVERNLARMADKTTGRGRALRPHFKTSKMIEVARLQVEGGAVGLTCATDRELEALLAGGIESVLWAHQPVGREKAELAVEANRHAEVMIALDSLESARAVAERAVERDVVVPYLIEVDTGMRRAGVRPGDAGGLAAALRDLPGLRPLGVMTHEGHVQRHVGEPEVLLAAAEAAWGRLLDAARSYEEAGQKPEVVSTGATSAALLGKFADGITEVRPGTYVFLDANQVAVGSTGWDDCAVTVLTRVVSHNRPGFPIIDAGLKEFSGDRYAAGSGHGHVPELGALVEPVYEEHGVLSGGRAGELRVGDVVRAVPNHVCGAVNMWSQAAVVRGDEVVAEWRTVGRR